MSRLLAVLVLAGAASADPRPRTDADGVPLPEGAIARLGSARFRTGGTPWCPVAFSPDGKQLAVSDTSAVSVFETATGRRLHRIALHDKHHPRAVRFLADGKHLGIGSGDWQQTAEFTVHDLTAGKVTATAKFTGKSQIFVIDASADGSRVLVEDRFLKLFLWDVPAAREIWSVPHAEATSTLPFTADGKHFVVAGYRKTELCDAETGKVVGAFPNPGPGFREYYQPGMASDGRIAIMSAKGDAVAVLAARGKDRLRLLTAERSVGRFTFSPNGRYLVAPDQGLTQVWDLTLPDDNGPVARLITADRAGFSPDSKTLALTDDGSTTLYTVDNWKPLPQSASPPSPVLRVRFLPPGDRVLGLTRPGWVIWPIADGPAKRLSDDSLVNFNGYSDVSADGRVALDVLRTPSRRPSERDKYALRVTDLATGKDRRIPLESLAWAPPVLISPDGRFVTTDVDGSELRVFNAATGEVVHRSKRAAGSTRFGASIDPDGRGLGWSAVGIFRPDNRGLAEAGPMYSEVTVTDHRTGRAWKMDPMPWSVYSGGARFSADGSRVIVLGRWGQDWRTDSVTVWDTRTGRRLLKWDRESGRVESVTLAPDQRSLLAGTMKGDLALLEVATGGERATFRHEGYVLSAAFNRDGTKAVSSSPDGPVYVWDLIGKPGAWEPSKADAVWTDMSSPDAKVAFAAVGTLRANPAEAVAFLKDRVKLPAAPSDETVTQWLKGLDAAAFGVRERSQRDLAAVAELIRPKLEAARKTASEEAGRRLDQILKAPEALTPEDLRRIRACEVLEGIGGPDALQLLRAWAAGPTGARLTQEAKESVARKAP